VVALLRLEQVGFGGFDLVWVLTGHMNFSIKENLSFLALVFSDL
jgi:hypothetical protein